MIKPFACLAAHVQGDVLEAVRIPDWGSFGFPKVGFKWNIFREIVT